MEAKHDRNLCIYHWVRTATDRSGTNARHRSRNPRFGESRTLTNSLEQWKDSPFERFLSCLKRNVSNWAATSQTDRGTGPLMKLRRLTRLRSKFFFCNWLSRWEVGAKGNDALLTKQDNDTELTMNCGQWQTWLTDFNHKNKNCSRPRGSSKLELKVQQSQVTGFAWATFTFNDKYLIS